MAYFANGSEGEYYKEKYCSGCVHGDKPCPVMRLHFDWNYDAVGKDADLKKQHALNVLWPRDGAHNGDCAMFFPKPT
jgi:hypothetical protein